MFYSEIIESKIGSFFFFLYLCNNYTLHSIEKYYQLIQITKYGKCYQVAQRLGH